MKYFYPILAFFISSLAYSQTLNLDTSFGTAGYFELSDNNAGLDNPDIIVNTDGSILLSTQRINGTNQVENIILKLTENGVLDTSFGVNGMTVLALDAIAEYGMSTKLQADGKIVLAGGYDNSKIIRLLANGQLDMSFGVNGVVLLNGISVDITVDNNTLLIQGDKIIINTYSPSTKALIRFNNDGTLDTSFGVDGYVNNVQSRAIFLDASSNIIGVSANNATNIITIEKFDSNGQLIASFGIGGAKHITSAFMDAQYRLLINIERINETTEITDYFEILRINLDGTLDNSFSYTDYSNAILPIRQATNDTYLIAGSVLDANKELSNLYISRIDDSGSADSTFNNTGFYIDNTFIIAEDLVRLSDGSILVLQIKMIDYDNFKINVAKYNLATLAVSLVNMQKDISFENPVNNQLFIDSNKGISTLELYDMKGILVKKQYSNSIDTVNLTRGIYIIKVYFDDGSWATKKMIKN